MTDKFKLKKEKDELYIIDLETDNKIDLSNKYDVQKLITILNDWHKIILNKWRI